VGNAKAEKEKKVIVPKKQLYEIVHVNGGKVPEQIFLLNTETGKVWRFVEYPTLNGRPKAWESTPQLNNVADLQTLMKMYPPVKAPVKK